MLMTYYSNRFPTRVLNLRGFEAQDIHKDQWGCPQIGTLAIKDCPGVRLGWNVHRPSERRPRTVLERWMGELGGRGTNVELNPESLEVKTAFFTGACANVTGSGNRLVVDIEGTGVLTELDDREVHVKIMHTMLHSPVPRELEDSPFMNEAYLAQLPRSKAAK